MNFRSTWSGGLVGAGGGALLAAPDTAQSLLAHESFDRAPGDVDTFPTEQAPDLAGTVDPAAFVPIAEDPLVLDHIPSQLVYPDGNLPAIIL